MKPEWVMLVPMVLLAIPVFALLGCMIFRALLSAVAGEYFAMAHYLFASCVVGALAWIVGVMLYNVPKPW